MPPALDVQTFHPTLGDGWRWIDTPPSVAVTVGATLSESASLLSVSDRDEAWQVSAHLLEAAPHVGTTWRNLTLLADVPLRAEWQGDVGVGDPRASLLLATDAWGVLRGSVTAPVGTLGWPYTWEEWRGGFSVSQTHGRVGAMLGTEKGAAGWGLRGALGATLKWATVEIAGTRTWTEIPVVSVETTLSHGFHGNRVTTAPFLSVGVLPGVGSPSFRLGVDVRRAPPQKATTTVPPPVEPVVPPAVEPVMPPPVEPVVPVEPTVPTTPMVPPVEPTVPTTPVVPHVPTTPVEPTVPTTPVVPPVPTTPVVPPVPTTPVEATPPRILRARVERHGTCNVVGDETEILQRLTDRAVVYLRTQGGADAVIEIVDAACAEKRWVDLIVVEVR